MLRMPKNIKIFLVSFLLITTISACSQNDSKAPIEATKLEAVLRDVHTAEAYSSLLGKDSSYSKYNGKNIDSLAVFYQEILNRHQISMQEFDSALKWYSLHPQELDSVYAHILPTFDSLKTVK